MGLMDQVPLFGNNYFILFFPISVVLVCLLVVTDFHKAVLGIFTAQFEYDEVRERERERERERDWNKRETERQKESQRGRKRDRGIEEAQGIETESTYRSLSPLGL
jgi:hypothetical protein